MLLATGKAQRFPIHAAIAAASPAETEADLAASPHGGTVMDVGARRYRSAATPRTNSLRRRCNSPSMAAAVVCRNHDMLLRSHAGAVAAVKGALPCPNGTRLRAKPRGLKPTGVFTHAPERKKHWALRSARCGHAVQEIGEHGDDELLKKVDTGIIQAASVNRRLHQLLTWA